MTVHVVADERFLQHETGPHPECKERLVGIYAHLREQGYLDGRLTPVARTPAADASLTAVHAAAHVTRMGEVSRRGGAMLDADTICGPESEGVAREAAGAACAMADAVMAGDGPQAGIALIRPPGHHATPQRAMGFCLYNNVAVVARHLQASGVGTVLILDWDVHHGNGTQDVFYDDPSVVFLSMHRYPFYPGTGAAHETGRGAGVGATINLPLPGSTARTDAIARFGDAVDAAVEEHAPEVILLSAGFDAYHRDPIADGGLGLDVEDYATLTDRVAAAARRTRSQRLISLLEGGYHLEDLPKMVGMHVDRLLAYAGA